MRGIQSLRRIKCVNVGILQQNMFRPAYIQRTDMSVLCVHVGVLRLNLIVLGEIYGQISWPFLKRSSEKAKNEVILGCLSGR